MVLLYGKLSAQCYLLPSAGHSCAGRTPGVEASSLALGPSVKYSAGTVTPATQLRVSLLSNHHSDLRKHSSAWTLRQVFGLRSPEELNTQACLNFLVSKEHGLVNSARYSDSSVTIDWILVSPLCLTNVLGRCSTPGLSVSPALSTV